MLKINEILARPYPRIKGTVSIYINELAGETHYEWTLVITHNSLEHCHNFAPTRQRVRSYTPAVTFIYGVKLK